MSYRERQISFAKPPRLPEPEIGLMQSLIAKAIFGLSLALSAGQLSSLAQTTFHLPLTSVAGGDFAAAIAAGNPVIAKGNTSHPGTTKLLTELAFAAVQEIGLPSGMVQLIYRTPRDVGQILVSHPLVGATGFTGSRYAGLQLKAAADKAGKPIYLEMSSVNPIFILPGALAERSEALGNELYNSCALGAGQFCTNPGLTIIPAGDHGDNLPQPG